MESLTTDTQMAQETGTISLLRRLLEQVGGVEVGTFTVEGCEFPGRCAETCIRKMEGHLPQGACELVRKLCGGESVEPDQCPTYCDKGHALSLYNDSVTNAAVLILRPQQVGDIEPSSQEIQRLQGAAELWDHIRRLEAESGGLADELIRSFEQLNVLFDITQEICKAHNIAQIKLFLMRRLAETLNCDWSCCLSPDDGVLWWCGDGRDDRNTTVDWVQSVFSEVMQEVMEKRTVLAQNRSQYSKNEQGASLLFGPLGQEDRQADIIVFGRRPEQPEFVSNDMLMTDSVLNHAQHVIANLKLNERLRTMSFEAVRALTSAIEKKDRYTCGHSERVGFLARLIGQQLGLDAEMLQDLEWGGVLHDVGKIGIKDGVLSKPGRLTEDEYDHIKQHVQMSYDIIAPIMSFNSVRDIVLYHHETPDGTGYPIGLKGDEIPLPAQIVHVADTFDALTSSRSYRRAFTSDKAIEIMRKESGTKLDARLVEMLIEAFEKFRIEQPDRFAKIFSHLQEQKTS